jgi:hypothetical protein
VTIKSFVVSWVYFVLVNPSRDCVISTGEELFMPSPICPTGPKSGAPMMCHVT